MAIKKSQLYSSLWQSCDELRGGMDASQYKDYGEVPRLKEPAACDPTCGTGCLLIKAANESGSKRIAIYGQEMDNPAWSLAA